MLIFAEQFTVILPRYIETPSSSWIEVRCSMPQYGPNAYLHHYDPAQVETDDIIGCGTDCSCFVGRVVSVDLSDPAAVTVVCVPLHLSGCSPTWYRSWHRPSVSAFGEFVRGLEYRDGKWITAGGVGAGARPELLRGNRQLIGECAVAAYPGGDVSVVDLKRPVFIGRSGHSDTFYGYRDLRPVSQ